MNAQFTIRPYLPTLVVSVVLFIMVFLPWATAEAFGTTFNFNGLEGNISGWGYLTLIMSIFGAGISFLVTQRYRSLGTIIIGILAILGIIIYWSRIGNFGFSLSYGLIIGFLASLGLMAVGYLEYRTLGKTPDTSPPPPPPSDTPPPQQ